MSAITTSAGTTITTKDSDQGPLVFLDHPDAPDDMRHCEVGRVVEGGGFQPASFAAWALTPVTLRAIADLIDMLAPVSSTGGGAR